MKRKWAFQDRIVCGKMPALSVFFLEGHIYICVSVLHF